MFCSSVHFFPTAPTFSSHVFCSCFFRQHQNFPFTWCSAVLFFRRHQNFPFTCSAVPIFPTAQMFHSRVLQFFFSDSTNFPATCTAVPFFPTAPKFSIHVVFCSPFFRQHKFSSHVYGSSFFSDRTKIFHSRGVLQFFFSDGTNFPATCGVFQAS